MKTVLVQTTSSVLEFMDAFLKLIIASGSFCHHLSEL